MTATPDPPAVQVYALGGFRVLVRGRLVEDQAWRRKSARQLFKHLLTRPSRRMTRDEMIEQLWPESETEAAATNVRSTLHALRRVLEPADAPSPTPVGIVFSDRDSVWLRTDVELWLDADAFDRTLEQARQTNDPQPLLEQAGALYIGDYLPDDLYEDEIIQRREALRRSWTNLQFERAKRNVEGGRPEAAVASLQRLLRADRCDERAAQELMVVLLQLRRRAEALRVYQQLEQGLREDLGVLPAERTHDLQRQAAATHTAAGPQSGKVFHCAYTFPRPHQIIGRDTDLARLQTLLDRGRTSGQAVLISAPAGTGKSALAGRLVDAARRSGVLCLAGAAYNEHSAVPLAAFQEAFTDYVLAASSNPLDTAIASAASELIAAVRELRLHAAVVGASRTDASAERSRIFTALLTLLRILADRSPVLLCLEDLHAADEATLHLLHYLI
ncbi:MAG TPA: AAA family ATPase, partial [Chloroflexota bacterium]|nr:AAA family ATPase [Chloroflexota bacterium]